MEEDELRIIFFPKLLTLHQLRSSCITPSSNVAFGSAWIYDILGQFDRLSKPVVISFLIANFGSVLLACGLWFGLTNVWAGFIGLIGWYLAGLGVTYYYLTKHLANDTEGKWTMKTLFWELYFGNVVALRNRMQRYIGRVPFVWCVLMKHFIPHILIILFVNLAQSQNSFGPLFGNYGGYVMLPFQALGIVCFSFTLFLFVVGVLFPYLYAPLALPQTKEAKMELAKYESGTEPSKNYDVEESDDGESPTGKDDKDHSSEGDEEPVANEMDA